MSICPTCKKAFGKDKWGRQRTFCSNSCQVKNAWKQGKMTEKKREGVKLSCVVCAVEYYIPQYRKEASKYCSRKCLAKDHLKDYVPVHGFKPGKNPPRKYKTVTVNGKCIREHRHIMQEHLGRKLETWEHVHHIDGNGLNNSLDNLQVVSNSEHGKLSYEERKATFS